jgi:hypothetical protein
LNEELVTKEGQSKPKERRQNQSSQVETIHFIYVGRPPRKC